MRPYATSVCGIKLLVYAALSYCMRASLLVCEALNELSQSLLASA
jgi:hypothetical protein